MAIIFDNNILKPIKVVLYINYIYLKKLCRRNGTNDRTGTSDRNYNGTKC